MVLYIVDDEKNIRDRMVKHIPWSELGFTSVITAKNGYDALDKMKETRPTVLLTDVRMPKMNGIDLSKEVKVKYPDCQIIFLSGFADKAYLMSAIEVKATKYIEKPIDRDDIYSTVASALKAYKTSASGRRSNLESLLLQLLYDNPDNDHALSQLLESGFNKTHTYTLLYVKFYWKKSDQPLAVKELLFNDDFWVTKETLMAFNDRHHLVVLSSSPLNDQLLTALVAPLEALLTDTYSLPFTIGISQTFSKLQALNLAYAEAESISDEGFFYGLTKHYIYGSDSTVRHTHFPNTMAFSNALEAMDEYIAKQLLNQLRLSSISKSYSEAEVRHQYSEWAKAITAAYVNAEITNDTDELNPFDSLPELHGMHTKLKSLTADYFSRVTEKRSAGGRAYEIMAFIKNNIDNDQLSVAMLAEHFELSSSYLCAAFKKSTQRTVNSYITELRIEKAKDLLKHSNMKVYEISESIGIADTNYFSVFFKKQTGVSPLEFRENP